MQRRQFIALLGGATTWPLAARAQQPERMRRIGVLMGYAESDRQGQANVAAFRMGLQKLGWTEGRNVAIEYRWAAAEADLVQQFAKELVARLATIRTSSALLEDLASDPHQDFPPAHPGGCL